MKVFVYFNLHKKMWSVKNLTTGKVVARTRHLTMENCEFKVSEKGRQRVLREKQKNVHAGIVGYVDVENLQINEKATNQEQGVDVTYNPYKYATFICRKDGNTIIFAKKAYLQALEGQAPKVIAEI